MTAFARPTFAIAFGAFILCAETCLHLADIFHPSSWIDFPIHDWIAGGFLVWSGSKSRHDWTGGRAMQAAAWGFMVSLLAGAFVAHWESSSTPAESDAWMSERVFVVMLGSLVVVSGSALVSTLLPSRNGDNADSNHLRARPTDQLAADISEMQSLRK
jgi:hypothetical protein